MNLVLFLIVGLAVVGLFASLARREELGGPPHEVALTPGDLESVVAELEGAPEGAFRALVVAGHEGELCIQYSVEGGVVGLDWVLLSPANLALVSLFEKTIAEEGFAAEHLEVNDVRYLRVVGPDIARIGRSVLQACGIALDAEFIVNEG